MKPFCISGSTSRCEVSPMQAAATDSYKASHFQMLCGSTTLTGAYGEARSEFKCLSGIVPDTGRVISNGIRYFVEAVLSRKWTRKSVEEANRFMQTFGPGGTSHPFPVDLLGDIEEEFDGYFPITLRALPDGTSVRIRTPQYVMTARGKYARLCTWLETLIISHTWYMSTVSTLSRHGRDLCEKAFDVSVDDDSRWLLSSRFHDFGFRGTSCFEQALTGAAAHLLAGNDGTDTLPGAFYATMHCNGGRPIGSSIPASEHSVMTSAPTEIDALNRIVDVYGNGVFATVADSYDYTNFLNTLLPQVADRVKAMGGFHVVRPDSGDPVACVVEALRALEVAYGATVNGKGYKVIQSAGVIQGDGIDLAVMSKILDAVLEAGYSAQCVAFGMGGGLLQKVNRDTLGYAVKLCEIEDNQGYRWVMKCPATDSGKDSIPGPVSVVLVDGLPTVVPYTDSGEDMLQVVYDCGPVPGFEFEDFDTSRARADRSWRALPTEGNPRGAEIRDRVADFKAGIRNR